VTTQNKLIQYTKAQDDKAWETVIMNTKDIRRESLAKPDQGNTSAAMDLFGISSSWNTKN